MIYLLKMVILTIVMWFTHGKMVDLSSSLRLHIDQRRKVQRWTCWHLRHEFLICVHCVQEWRGGFQVPISSHSILLKKSILHMESLDFPEPVIETSLCSLPKFPTPSSLPLNVWNLLESLAGRLWGPLKCNSPKLRIDFKAFQKLPDPCTIPHDSSEPSS